MYQVPSHIKPKDPDDQARWKEQALRYRLLTGQHTDDVRDEIEDMFSAEIAVDMTVNPDLSRNPMRLVFQQLNVAYLEPPDVQTPVDQEDLSPVVTPSLWAMQQRTALFTLAIQESLVRLDWKHWLDDTEVSYRPVTPDLVVLEPMPGRVNIPGRVEEIRFRDGEWTWEVWDVRDPNYPIFRIDTVDVKGKRVDSTAIYAPELNGAYPYYDKSGIPILPYILYHSRVSHQMWNWHEGIEISRASLRLAALWSHWSDSFTSASHPQRWALDVESQAGITKQISGISVDVVPTDRKSILKFHSKGPSGGQLGQYQPTLDPLRAAESLRLYEQGLAVYAGLNPSDLQVTQGQSGYAIVVSRSGQRRIAKLVEPSLRISDQLLLSTGARLANAYGGYSMTEEPREYTITYRGLERTPEERHTMAEALKVELDMGLISRIDAIRTMNPEIESDEEALERLLKANAIKAQVPFGDDTDGETIMPPLMGAEVENIQLTALNGAQVGSAQEIVQAVASRDLPRDSGVSMLISFFNLPPSVAESIMGSVGRSFFNQTNSITTTDTPEV